MKVSKVRPEVLNDIFKKAIVSAIHAAYGVTVGVKVTGIQTETQDLQPVGIKHNVRFEVQLTLDATDEIVAAP